MSVCSTVFSILRMYTLSILGKGADLNKPPCRKAKDIRREQKLQRNLQNQTRTPVLEAETLLGQNPKPKTNQPKSVEDFIFASLPPEAVHQLEVLINKQY